MLLGGYYSALQCPACILSASIFSMAMAFAERRLSIFVLLCNIRLLCCIVKMNMACPSAEATAEVKTPERMGTAELYFLRDNAKHKSIILQKLVSIFCLQHFLVIWPHAC